MLFQTPGPAAHDTVIPDRYNNRNAAPKYSMTSRNHMPGDASQKPGPGAHSPEKVSCHDMKISMANAIQSSVSKEKTFL